jgi:hypothetical protein
MTFLEIDATGWVAIIGAIGTLITGAGVTAVGVIMALRKLDAAAERREQIKNELQPGLSRDE